MTSTTTPDTIAAASGFVRAEVALRTADRALRTTLADIVGVDPEDACPVLAPAIAGYAPGGASSVPICQPCYDTAPVRASERRMIHYPRTVWRRTNACS
jgi:hypothetical protein